MRVMVFGVFDGLHKGHREFLSAARKRGDYLIVVVARDDAVRALKKKTPRRNEKERMQELRQSALADRVVLGDKEQGTYSVIVRYAPNSICLGYDQDTLRRDLEARMAQDKIPLVGIVRLAAYKPKQWHTSLLTRDR